jgi:hypothetical protein
MYHSSCSGLDQIFAAETCLFVSSASPEVVHIGIDDNDGRTFGGKPFGQQSQERGAVALADRAGFADERIDCARTCRQMMEMWLRPGVHVIILDVCERPALVRDDPHDHARLVKIFPEQFGLLLGVTPPTRYVRSA